MFFIMINDITKICSRKSITHGKDSCNQWGCNNRFGFQKHSIRQSEPSKRIDYPWNKWIPQQKMKNMRLRFFRTKKSHNIFINKIVYRYSTLPSTCFLKFSKIACRPAFCISRSWISSASKVSVTVTHPHDPSSWNKTSTTRPASRKYSFISPIV